MIPLSTIKTSNVLYIDQKNYSAYLRGHKVNSGESIDIHVGWFIGEKPDVQNIIQRIQSASKILNARYTVGKIVYLSKNSV